jgi:hypothetical protein
VAKLEASLPPRALVPNTQPPRDLTGSCNGSVASASNGGSYSGGARVSAYAARKAAEAQHNVEAIARCLAAAHQLPGAGGVASGVLFAAILLPSCDHSHPWCSPPASALTIKTLNLPPRTPPPPLHPRSMLATARQAAGGQAGIGDSWPCPLDQEGPKGPHGGRTQAPLAKQGSLRKMPEGARGGCRGGVLGHACGRAPRWSWPQGGPGAWNSVGKEPTPAGC